MKKLFYMFLLSLLVMLSGTTEVDAASKVEKAELEITFNEKDGYFYMTFHHPHQNAVVYCKYNGNREYTKVTVGKPVKISYVSKNIKHYNKVGSVKSEITTINLKKTLKKLTKEDIKREFSTIINKTDNEFVKYIKINQWFVDNFTYESKLSSFEDNRVHYAWFRQKGVCAGISLTYELICKTFGIKCEYVDDDIVDYNYLDNHAWVHVTINDTVIPLDVTSLTSGIYNDIREYIDLKEFYGMGVSYLDAEDNSYYTFVQNIFSDSCTSYELENNEVTLHWEDGAEKVYTYVENENRWHLVVYEANGEVRWDYDWTEEA